MYKTLSALFFLFVLPQQLLSQILPGEDSKLNYRIIGFSFPLAGTVKYKIEIAFGNHNNQDSFQKNIIKSVVSKTDKTIAEVPAFASQYTWRVVYTHKNLSISKSALHHFSTTYAPMVDTCDIRLRIIKPAVKYKDDYVFIDGNRTLYDMKGVPVWYLPEPANVPRTRTGLRDLRISPQGTITFISNEQIFEINYYGDTLWKGPQNGSVNGDDTEHYHHEFTRLTNGHYVVMGMEHVYWDHPLPYVTDTGNSVADDTVKGKRKTLFGTLIEYDEDGKLVWLWKSSQYFMQSDLVNYQPEGKSKTIDVHANSFFFDEKDSVVYVSFKNISRILKVKYPGGNVIRSYGEVFKPGVPPVGNGMFCDQHACKRSQKGYLYMYNNNGCNDSVAPPRVIMLQEPVSNNGNLKIVWEYDCSFDDVKVRPLVKKARAQYQLNIKNKLKIARDKEPTLLHATTGGNVIELPDHSIFVCMNIQNSKVFIVSQDKKILWSATPEKWNLTDWYIFPQQYKASIINRKQLERLIWNKTLKSK